MIKGDGKYADIASCIHLGKKSIRDNMMKKLASDPPLL